MAAVGAVMAAAVGGYVMGVMVALAAVNAGRLVCMVVVCLSSGSS